MLDAREPPHGDFVAYVEQIEREQLARALQPHRLPHLATGSKAISDAAADAGTRSLSAAEAQRVLQQLKAQGSDGAAPSRGAMIGAFIGAALIAFGLLAEGGIPLVILGAVLLWHNLRKLRRPAGAASPTQQVDRFFGHRSAGKTGGRGA